MMNPGKKLSIIVPAFNEAGNIPRMLEGFAEVIKRPDVELILVDNGSSDDTAAILVRLRPKYPFLRCVKVEVNQGYGFGIVSGLRQAEGKYLCWTHADLQTDPGDTIKALEIIERSNDPQKSFVKGARKGRPWLDAFFTFGMGLFESLYLGFWMQDINAQPNLFSRSFFESWENPPHDFSLDLYAFYLARKKNLKIIRFPVFFGKRVIGHSHWDSGFRSRLKFIARVIGYSTSLKRKVT